MNTILAYLLSPIFQVLFILSLLIFDPLQRIARVIFGHKAQQYVVYVLNYVLYKLPLIGGINIKLRWEEKPPVGQPYIFVANHQSLYDMPPIIWHTRMYMLKYIAKKELAQWVPSISYNLRIGGSLAIDRKDRNKTLEDIKAFAHRIKEKKQSIFIFPEGTRSRTGVPKKWKTGGLKTILEIIPEAQVLPVSIRGSHTFPTKGWLLPIGQKIEFYIHKPRIVHPDDESLAKLKKVVDGYQMK